MNSQKGNNSLGKTSELSPWISMLLAQDEIDAYIENDSSLLRSLIDLVELKLKDSYCNGNVEARKDLQTALFMIYNSHLSSPLSAQAKNQYHHLIVTVRKLLEQGWLDYEKERFNGYPKNYQVNSFKQQLKDLLKTHRVVQHPLFDYLEKSASEKEFNYFFKSDCALNVLFFDLVAMTLIGSLPETRGEISKNLWDEAGAGDPSYNHVDLYKYLLKEREIPFSEDNYSHLYNWQGITGYNVFMLGGVNRQHYYKLLGAMAMTELLDPPQYSKLVNGAKRIGINGKHIYYYTEHIEVDIEHAEGWLERVILPIIRKEPGAMYEIYIGAILRLQSCADYYDGLMNSIVGEE